MWKVWQDLVLLLPLWALSASVATACPSKQELIDTIPFEELGGVLYHSNFQASNMVQTPHGERPAMSVIYYLEESSASLEDIQFIRKKSDDTLDFYMGNVMTIFQISSDGGNAEMIRFGPNVLGGDLVQWTVPASAWYTSIVNGNTGNENNATGFAVIGSVVAPGWEEQDLEVANATQIFEEYPRVGETITSWLNDPNNFPVYCNDDAESVTTPTVEQLVDLYNMQPHPEGGYFLETYRSTMQVEAPWANRSALTAIYYLMTSDDEGIEHSDFHRLTSDETWSYYFGDPIHLYVLNNAVEGDLETIVLGTDLAAGQRQQYNVPAGTWFGAEVPSGGSHSYGLIGAHVAPGFEFADWELGVREELVAAFPGAEDTIVRLTSRRITCTSSTSNSTDANTTMTGSEGQSSEGEEEQQQKEDDEDTMVSAPDDGGDTDSMAFTIMMIWNRPTPLVVTMMLLSLFLA